MKNCAFLSMASLEAFECYDHLLIEPMAALGWQVQQVPWRNKHTNWDHFEAVIVRSSWDYQDDPGRFMNVIKNIDRSSAQLENSRRLIRWNLNKKYLAEIEQQGISIVPTFWGERTQSIIPDKLFECLKADKIIIKPTVSANADHTYRLNYADLAKRHKISRIFSDREFMAQPFMANILSEGEYSLFYFAGRYSHAILKTPQPGDFRVQEEHGGRLRAVKSAEQLQSLGCDVIRQLPQKPLYARIDFVRSHEDSPSPFLLMEIELIEPSLYFNMDPASPARFARAFDNWMQQKGNRYR